jgi:hypothetical protein
MPIGRKLVDDRRLQRFFLERFFLERALGERAFLERAVARVRR